MTILLCIFIPAVFYGSFPVQEPYLEIVGFSEDGCHLAYTLTGEYEGSAFPYCEIYILDLETGDVTETFFGVDETQSISCSLLMDNLITSHEEDFTEYGIAFGDHGVLLEFPPLDSPPDAEIVSFIVHGDVVGFPEGLYSLDLFQITTDSLTEYYEMNPSFCVLNLTRAENSISSNLLDSSISPLIEYTVYRYRQNGFLLHPSGYFVVFIACTVEGFEIPETVIIPLVFSFTSNDGTCELM
ncbi:MAG: DUF2259 domain-containing protein [Candidatus Aegiribacteria sp.]|nr:DUF2259 domain-containing protein [Candidatus Aegiribacteria sp.]